jgi:hypothetical protein
MNRTGEMTDVSPEMVAASAQRGQVPPPVKGSSPSWVRWILPSISDVFFLVLFGLLGFSPMSVALLQDADTGWHIRNGEFIMATHSVPHADFFSYTRAGQPWYAWEWLYDVLIAAIHHVAGLNGVVLFTAFVIALTFALLFRFVLRRSGSFAVATLLTLLAVSAAQVHMLARPHVLSWLFTLLWVEVLYRFEEGQPAALYVLPGLMLLWVNLHGGFIVGLVLIGLFGCAHIWDYLKLHDSAHRRQIVQLAVAFCASLAVTFLTPYGYKLHWHVYQYLSNHYLMDSINEFRSPNFHAVGYGYFECFILLSVLGLILARKKVGATDLFLLLFSIHAALYAARNIPISAIMMSLSLGPLLAGIIAPQSSQPSWIRCLADSVQGISTNMGEMEKHFRGHALAIILLAASALIALNGGRVLSAQVLSAHFNEKEFPVAAAEFIAASGIHDHMFNSDDWSGYLIYRLYPATKLYFDDRHDFYGEAFVKEYEKASNGTREWREPLEKYQVRWVLAGIDSPLSSVLRESKNWRVAYSDNLATIFNRVQ